MLIRSLPSGIYLFQPSRATTLAQKFKAFAASPNSHMDQAVEARDLWPEVVKVYSRAQEKRAAFKTPTQSQMVVDKPSGIVFKLLVSESLQEKSRSAKNSDKKMDGEKRINPFLPYEQDLWVAHLSDTHTLLLNKFNLTDHHLLVVTREFEEQEVPLTIGDIGATMRVMQSMPRGGLAFFNCGPQSGASQPHKHVQVIPLPIVPELNVDVPIGQFILGQVTSEAPVFLEGLPLRMVACKLSALESPEQVHCALGQLLQQVQEDISVCGSYNLLFTKDWMVLIPRRNRAAGPCDVNAMVFSGSLYIKSTAEMEYVEDVGPMAILSECGFSNHELQRASTDDR